MAAKEILPQLDRYEDQPESESLSKLLDRRGAEQFVAAHPEYFPCDKNGQLLQDWINSRGGCGSARNFELAYRELQKQGALESRPTEPEPIAPKPDQGVQKLGQTIFVRDGVTPEDREKYADHPHESDDARKKRDEQLRRAAVADRIARRKVSR